MRLVAGDGTPWSAGRELVHALSWGLGVAVGVLVGALLTYAGSQGAPGSSSLGPRDLVVVPLAAGGIVTTAHVLLSIVAGLVRGRTAQTSVS
jgi:hypothetical protein